MKKDAFYFQHDYNASTDVKCLFLRQALGMEGYGIYWFLVEQLANAGGYLPLTITPVLSMQMQVTEIKVQSVINNFGLFTIDQENNFFSRRLNEHLEIRKSLSESGKIGALKRWNNKKNSHPINVPISDPNAKERKVKENKIYIDRIYFEKSKEIDEAFKDYLAIRIKYKYTMTDRAIESLIKKLRELSGNEEKISLSIIENAILGKWQSFYPEK